MSTIDVKTRTKNPDDMPVHNDAGRSDLAVLLLLDAEGAQTQRRESPSVGTSDELADLDQVPVGIAHVTPDLDTAVDWRCQKLRPAGAPLFVNGANVGDTDVQEPRCVIGIRGRLERDVRLVDRGASGSADGDPAVPEGDDRELTPPSTASPPSTSV